MFWSVKNIKHVFITQNTQSLLSSGPFDLPVSHAVSLFRLWLFHKHPSDLNLNSSSWSRNPAVSLPQVLLETHTHTQKEMTEHSCGILTLWHKRNFLRFEGHREKGEMLFGLTTTTPWFNVKWATKLKDTGEKEDSTHSHFNCKVIKLLIQYTSSLN